MRLPLILAAAPCLALVVAACEPQATPPADAPPAAPDATLAGVDLSRPVRALGTEPFWSVEITPQDLTFTGVDRAEIKAAHAGPSVQGAAATWTARPHDGAGTEAGSGGEWTVVLTAADCSDGMSDRTYPLTARVTLGAETLNGCAAATAAILGAGESGRVVEAPAA